MKKVIFSALSLFLMFFIVSCEKSEVISEVHSETLVENSGEIETRAASNLRVWFDNGAQPGTDGVDYGCKDSGGNCLATVVVVGIANQEVVGGVIDVVEGGDPAAIADAFASNSQVLRRYIDAELVQGASQGAYSVRNRGKFSEETSAYLQFGAGGEIISVADLKM